MLAYCFQTSGIGPIDLILNKEIFFPRNKQFIKLTKKSGNEVWI